MCRDKTFKLKNLKKIIYVVTFKNMALSEV